jgi:hypothetical protein
MDPHHLDRRIAPHDGFCGPGFRDAERRARSRGRKGRKKQRGRESIAGNRPLTPLFFEIDSRPLYSLCFSRLSSIVTCQPARSQRPLWIKRRPLSPPILGLCSRNNGISRVFGNSRGPSADGPLGAWASALPKNREKQRGRESITRFRLPTPLFPTACLTCVRIIAQDWICIYLTSTATPGGKYAKFAPLASNAFASGPMYCPVGSLCHFFLIHFSSFENKGFVTANNRGTSSEQ